MFHLDENDQIDGRVFRSLPRMKRAATAPDTRRRPRSIESIHDTSSRMSNEAAPALIKEAQELPDPLLRRRVKSCSLVDGIVMYEFGAFDIEPSNSSRPQRSPSRFAGLMTIDTSIDHLESALSSERRSDPQALHQDMTRVDLLHLVLEERHKSIAIQRMQLQPRGMTMARRRDFIVVESQRRFRLTDGREGLVVSVESLFLPGHVHHDDGVLGTIHRSGIVAIESQVNGDTLEVVATAQIDLGGSSSSGAQRAVSRRRVTKLLEGLNNLVDKHRVELMTFPGTNRFLEIEFEQSTHRCKTCWSRVGRGALLGLKKARHSCRRCGGTVCKDCSQMWEIERQRTTVAVGGGLVTTPTRVCNECLEASEHGKGSPSDKIAPPDDQNSPHKILPLDDQAMLDESSPTSPSFIALTRSLPTKWRSQSR